MNRDQLIRTHQEGLGRGISYGLGVVFDQAYAEGRRDENERNQKNREFVDLVAQRLGVTLRDHGITTDADWTNLVEAVENFRNRSRWVDGEAWRAIVGLLWPDGGNGMPVPDWDTNNGRRQIVDAIRVMAESSRRYVEQLAEMRQRIDQANSTASRANTARVTAEHDLRSSFEEIQRLKGALAGERARGRRDVLRDLRKAAAKADEDARADGNVILNISPTQCEGGC